MAIYDKGDKTQQGMSANGWVWGQLQLNRKRDVFVAVTSNEEEEGLGGVFIKVHDDLNDLDYVLNGSDLPVGESVIGGVIPSGTIEITENAEGIDVSEYALADVNVSGDSIPKCTVTFNNDRISEQHIATYIGDYICLSNGAVLKNIDTVQPSESATYTFIYEKDGDFYYIGYNSDSLELTNAVNCEEITTGDWTGYISPIDPTLDSSFTITVGGLGGGGLE